MKRQLGEAGNGAEKQEETGLMSYTSRGARLSDRWRRSSGAQIAAKEVQLSRDARMRLQTNPDYMRARART